MEIREFWAPPLWWKQLWSGMDKAIRRGFHVDPFSFTLLIAFGASLLLFVVCMPLICCCAKRKKSQRNARDKNSEPIKRRFPLTVARFDEFEALSPLIVSPNSSSTPSFRQKRGETDRIRASRELFLRQHNIRPDESPPPPRRFNGRTVIVPLASNSSRVCRPLIAPLLGTPDSRVTSFEIGTTKSCATIPEDDEFELSEDEPNHTIRHLGDDDEITTEGDLVSIDRTYISTRDSRCNPPRFRHLIGNYVPSPVPVPEFQISAPTYTPPAPPKISSVHSTPVRQRQIPSRHDTNNTQGQSNLSSPEMSSCGFDSMVETVESDFMIAIDVEESEKMIIDFEQSSEESAQQQLKNLQLQRIEEESEQFDEASSISRFLYSSSASSLSKFNNTNMRMPRSISQQLEMMMINNNAH